MRIENQDQEGEYITGVQTNKSFTSTNKYKSTKLALGFLVAQKQMGRCSVTKFSFILISSFLSSLKQEK